MQRSPGRWSGGPVLGVLEMTSPNTFNLLNLTSGCGPRDLVRDPSMTLEEKRSLLASWASDARAVPNHPALRRLDDGRLVTIDDVLDALKALDRLQPCSVHFEERRTTSIRPGHWSRLARLWRRSHDDDDDDDPPPAPASIRPNQPVSGGSLAAAA